MPPITPAPTTEGSSPAPAAPATPPVPATPVTPTAAPVVAAVPAEAPKALTAREILAKASPEQRQQLATGKVRPAASATPAPVATPAAVVATPPVVAAPAAPAEPAAATPPAAPAAEGDPAALPERFRFTTDDDRMIALIAKRENIGLSEAVRRFEATRNPAGAATPQPSAPASAATPAAPATPPAATPAPHEARITAIDTDIAAKRAEVKKLREDMEHDKADDLMVEIGALQGEKQLIAAEARRAETQQAQSFESAVMASRERAFTQFPELGDPTSPEHVGLIGYVTMEQAKPERQAFFQRHDYPELIAQEFKQKYGKPASAATPAVSTPATPPAAAATPAAPAPVVTKTQAKQVSAVGADGRLLTTAAGSTPAPREMTAQEAITASRSDPKLRQALRQAVMRRPAPTA